MYIKYADPHSGNIHQHIDLKGLFGSDLDLLPYCLRLLAENHIRQTGDVEQLRQALRNRSGNGSIAFEFVFRPNRILMHDTTCTPALADIAGMRDTLAESGVDPAVLSPDLPVEVSVDHSLAVDQYASPKALNLNSKTEIERNRERYGFLRWASQSMNSVHVNPPGTGIMHTINLEQIATVLEVHSNGDVHPDMLLGTDSHTTMINGIGVLGWGVGGLEAESVMFGQSISLGMPEIVGVYMDGKLPAGTFSTDLALEVTYLLRKTGVTGSFVEFFGPGVTSLSADDRAVIANMAPEYGATTGYFPVDAETINYLERTARPKSLTSIIGPIFRNMGLWFDANARPNYDRTISIDLSVISPVVAGPRRPQDKIDISEARSAIESVLGRNLESPTPPDGEVPDGAIGIAAITSCTNTTDPRLLIAAGLLARKARILGLRPPHWVKTSLAPGSPAALAYLTRSGLLEDLSAVGFDIVGYGCTTCIGNSGPLPKAIEIALDRGKAISAILSGNRNFPGRVHPKLDLGYLASPPLVVAFALVGEVVSDIQSAPIGKGRDGNLVYLADIWPTTSEIDAVTTDCYRAKDIKSAFQTASKNPTWNDIPVHRSARYPWSKSSVYLRRPEFISLDEECRLGAYEAQPLLVLGDDITTDHISPAGWIDPKSEAGKWLIANGADPKDLNVYAAYRGNWEVMLRGVFTNRLAVNYLVDELRPGYTNIGDEPLLPIYKAAEALHKRKIPTVLLAGVRYGMGSSRDWAAKGVALLGVRAVIARSFERIHRSNLIGMGVLPLEIVDDFIPAKAEITPADRISIDVPASKLVPLAITQIILAQQNEGRKNVAVRIAVETQQEIETLKQGGVLTKILNEQVAAVG